jgi:segregation and condensation protein B
MQTLLERGLVSPLGRAQVIGHPMNYGTTALFLEYFGLGRLEDLPAADELRRLNIQRPPAPVTADAGLATAPPEQLKEEGGEQKADAGAAIVQEPPAVPESLNTSPGVPS